MKTTTRDLGALIMGVGFGSLIRSAIGVSDATIDLVFVIVMAAGAYVFLTQKTKAANNAAEVKVPRKL